MQPPFCTLAHLLRRNYRRADRIARKTAYIAYVNKISHMSRKDIENYIDKATGGLGYLGKPGQDDYRVITLGCYIAWAEKTAYADRVLEIGTGLGRTNYCVRYMNKSAIIHSIEIDPIILGIALYQNPYEYFSESLRNNKTLIFLNDAFMIIDILRRNNEIYDHIIHDGGPNPGKNTRIYSYRFLNTLYKLLRKGGSISIFAGKNPYYVKRIYNDLKNIGFKKLETINPPGIPVRIIHGEKQ